MPFLVVLTGKGFFYLCITMALIAAFLCKTHEAIVLHTTWGRRHTGTCDPCGAPLRHRIWGCLRQESDVRIGESEVVGWKGGLNRVMHRKAHVTFIQTRACGKPAWLYNGRESNMYG